MTPEPSGKIRSATPSVASRPANAAPSGPSPQRERDEGGPSEPPPADDTLRAPAEPSLRAQQKRRRLGDALLLGAAFVFDLVLIALAIASILDSRRLPVEINPSARDDCPWTVTLVEPGRAEPSPPLGDPDVGGRRERQEHCVVAINGFELDETSLAREAMQLPSRKVVREWADFQRRLFWSLDAPEASITVVAEGERHTHHVAVNDTQSAGDLGRLILGLLAVLGTVGIGLLVRWKRPDSTAARALFGLSQGVAGTILPTVVTELAGTAQNPIFHELFYVENNIALMLGASSVFLLAATFPEPLLGRLSGKVVSAVSVVLVLPLFVLDRLELVFIPGLLVAGIQIPLSLVLMAISLFRSRGQLSRMRARWVIWGILVPSLLWFVLRVPSLVGLTRGRDPSDFWIVLSAVSIPLGVGMAILRHGLFDIDLVLRRTVLGAAIAALVLYLYQLAVMAFAAWVTGVEAVEPEPFELVVLAVVALGLSTMPALNSWMDQVLDRLLRRGRRAMKPEEEQAIARVHSLEEAATRTVALLARLPDIRGALIHLRGQGAPRSWSSTGEAFEAPPELAEFWEELRPGELQLLSSEPSNTEPTPLTRWQLRTGLELVLPFDGPEGLRGVVAVAPSPRGTLTSEDLELLRQCVASFVLALRRALAIQRLQETNLRLEAEVARRAEEIEQAKVHLHGWEQLASLGVLSAGLAHELNTPLGALLSSAEQLTAALPRTESPQRAERLARICQEGARRCGEIVSALQSYSSQERREPEPTDLPQLLDATLRLLGSTLREASIEVVQEIEEDLPRVQSYPGLLSQTFTNLLLNASAAIGRSGTITVRMKRQGEGLRLEFEDTGPGVPPELGQKVFAPFFTTKAAGVGTGLGLALCRAMVEQHAGRISEEGRPGAGALFVIQLPLDPSAERAGNQQLTPLSLTNLGRLPGQTALSYSAD